MGGVACYFQQHSIKLLTSNAFSLPLSPYFALGPIDGSPCDTLGINNPVATLQSDKVKERIKVFPNPANDILNIEIANNSVSLQYKIYDILGKEIQNGALQSQILLKNLNNGIYCLSILDKNGGLLYPAAKFVVLHE